MSKRKITPILQSKTYESPKIARVNNLLPPRLDTEIELVITKEMAAQALAEGVSIKSNARIVGGTTFTLSVSVSSNEVDSITNLNLTPSLEVSVGDAHEWTLWDVHVQLLIINYSDFRKSLFFIHSNTFTSTHPDLTFSADVNFSDEELLSPDASAITLRLVAFAEAPIVYSLPSLTPPEKFSGLLNLGATCYLNGLIQSLFHLGKFREIIYAGNGSAERGTTLHALQTVFFDLERSRTLGKSCTCTPLVAAFGWDNLDVAVQQDVHELSRLLCDRVERDLKTSGRDLEIKSLFQGKIEIFIECIDVDYRSTKIETFYDLQLHLTDQHGNFLPDIAGALAQLTAVEILEGADAYDAEKFGKQRARKGVRIVEFPAVLQLQLMRFRYNVELGDFEKVNDRFEFPEKLELAGGMYSLHTVLVHTGGVNSGHYFSYISINGQWYKFDDDRVTGVEPHVAVSYNFGGPYTMLPGNYLANVSPSPGSARARKDSPVENKPFSAYLLMYVRDDMKDSLLNQPTLSSVNPELHASLVNALRRDLEIVILEPEDVEGIVKRSVFWDARNFREIASTNFRKFPEEATVADFGLSDVSQIFVLERCMEGSRFRRLRDNACLASLTSAVDPDTLICMSMPESPQSSVLVLLKVFDPSTCTITSVHFTFMDAEDFMAELEVNISEALGLHVTEVVLKARVFLESNDGVNEVDLRDMHASFTIHDGLVFITQQSDPASLDVLEFLENVRNTVTISVTLHSIDGGEPTTLQRHADLRTLAQDFFQIPDKRVALYMDDPNCNDIPEMLAACGSTSLSDLLARSDYDASSSLHCIIMESAPDIMLCVRFFNDHVEEVGMQVLRLQGYETLADVKRMIKWDVTEPLRAMEIFEGRIIHVYEEAMFSFTSVSSLACFGKCNFLYHSLRIEKSGRGSSLLCAQIDNGEVCGHPFILDLDGVGPREALAKKLGLSDASGWRINIVGEMAEVERPAVRISASRNLNIK